MEKFFRDLSSRAASLDEVLGADFEPLPSDRASAELSVRRLAAWCRSCANGDWEQFGRRLAVQGWRFEDVLTRFAASRRKPTAPEPQWLNDAIWVEAAMRDGVPSQGLPGDTVPPAYPFVELTLPLVEKADKLVWEGARHSQIKLTPCARNSLCQMLLEDLSGLCAPAFYERFVSFRSAGGSDQFEIGSGSKYKQFVDLMRNTGLREVFESKPVLLRLIAVLTRQWIDTTREFLLRLDADASNIAESLLGVSALPTLEKVESSRSDRHNGGHTVVLLSFANNACVVYKPKDLRVDEAWKGMIHELNTTGAPIDLRMPITLKRDGYGWTEFIEHTGCKGPAEITNYFRRAGAWLALLHRFLAADMHQENIIASGEHPIPIDLETIFHTRGDESDDLQDGARGLVRHRLGQSVMMVGLLPAYGRSAFNNVFAVGGLTSGWMKRTRIAWENVNSDGMRPARLQEDLATNPNLPHIDGHYATFKEHIGEFVSGFQSYADFLSQRELTSSLLKPFSGMRVRTVLRPTRFYYMLQQRLRNHKMMHDGVIWSAQADFLARLPNPSWDPAWHVQQMERDALLSLNIPHFTSRTDKAEFCDQSGLQLARSGMSGMERAQARCQSYDSHEIEWQAEVITENTRPISASLRARIVSPPHNTTISSEMALAEASRIVEEISQYAIRKDDEAAWIGREWFEDAEAFQLACLGPDLYNGSTGIALFLAAHAKMTGSQTSKELSLAAVRRLRSDLKKPEGGRLARSLGLGGATGFSSIFYTLGILADLLDDSTLRSDALRATRLVTADVIAADTRLDLIGGSAGAILCLLKVYRDTDAPDVIERAVACGEHLLRQPRSGTVGARTWPCAGAGAKPLTGMSHGAAGFAYALAALYAATSDEKFAQAAHEALAFENNTYDARRNNWPDLRPRGEPAWSIRWCHGAPGIGLARSAMTKMGGAWRSEWLCDVARAAACTEPSWTGDVDTLCCGSLGNIELLREAAEVLGREELRHTAAQALADVISSARQHGDYRWNSGARKFNLGLFRGLAGVGYTCLREVNPELPNVLIWE